MSAAIGERFLRRGFLRLGAVPHGTSGDFWCRLDPRTRVKYSFGVVLDPRTRVNYSFVNAIVASLL